MKMSMWLPLIIALALAVRFIYFQDSLTFFYDQARDALMAMEIFQGDPIKILGPTTDLPGLHHGPLYWYLLAPIYFLTNGNPYFVRFFLILINILAIFFVYDLAKQMFKNEKVAYLASFFFAISFEATQYARWLSNPAPAVLTSLISFWALFKLINGKSWALIPLLTSWGLSVQFQFFMLYQIVVFLVIWISVKGSNLPKIPNKTYALAISGFILSISTYIVSEVKFNFQSTKALLKFFKSQTFFGESFISMLTDYLDRLVDVFFLNLWGINLFIAGLATFITLYLAVSNLRVEKVRKPILFLIVWILSPIFINFFTGPDANFINVGVGSGVIILSSFLLYEVSRKNKLVFVVFILLIVSGNLVHIVTKNKYGEVLFTVQKNILLGDEQKVIDWIYLESGGKPFRLNTVTAPLFINTTWVHLFNWYGNSKYGYMPMWWGETQVDVAGSKIAFAEKSDTDVHFLIIEPNSNSDDFYPKAIKYMENTRSIVEKREKIGFFTIEKRKVVKETTFTSGDVIHLVTTIDMKELQKVE